jgi:fatty-acyl-CoA synthase
MNLNGVGRYWARWEPDATAIRWAGQDISWAELELRTKGLASGLQEIGLRPGDRVGILGGNCPEWCELTLATLRAGAVVVPMNPRLSPAELSRLVSDAGCAVVGYDAALAGRFAEIADQHPKVTRLGLHDGVDAELSVPTLRTTDRQPAEVAVAANDPAIITYTSGTTGLPRGVTLTHANVLAAAQHWQQADGWTRDINLLACVSLAFTGGIVNNFMAAYCCGATLVLEPDFDPQRALTLIVGTPINVMIGVPVMFQGIASAEGFAEADLTALRTAITGGSPVPASLLRAYQRKGVHIRQAYALSEAAGSVCLLPPRHALDRLDSAGMPQLHTRIRVVDDHDRDVATGEVGQILVSGPQVMAGYWNNPEATAATIIDGWLHTGDLGRLDEHGYVSVVDRKNDKIISGGLNLYPAEIENVVADFPGVTEVGAFGVPHERWGETVAVAVGGVDIDVPELIAHCRHHLGDYKVPRYVWLATEPLPRSGSGKVLRRRLKESFDPTAAIPTGAR